MTPLNGVICVWWRGRPTLGMARPVQHEQDVKGPPPAAVAAAQAQKLGQTKKKKKPTQAVRLSSRVML